MKKQRVELRAVPDHGTAGGDAEQQHEDLSDIAPGTEGFPDRRGRGAAILLHLSIDRRLMKLETDIDRYREQEYRREKGDAPAPRLEDLIPQGQATGEHREQGQEQTDRAGGLKPAGVVAAAGRLGVLRHIGCCAAIFAPHRQTLGQAQEHQEDGRPDADLRIGRQQSDHQGRQTHDDHRDHEAALAADPVTQPAEHERADRAGGETRSERGETREKGGGFITGGKEQGAEENREAAVEEKNRTIRRPFPGMRR